MKRVESIVVDVLRDFLVASEVLGELVAAHDSDRLVFEDVAAWVGDEASTVLFRLKEHCHALLQAAGPADVGDIGPAELIDLVVGSLFHEAMKLRENLYQVEAYATRFEKLRTRARPADADSIRELEHLLELSGRHLHEAFYEARSLMQLARRHVRGLLLEHRTSGLVARCLYEHADVVARVFEAEVDPSEEIRLDLIHELYSGPAQAAVVVARSYLESAYFEEALGALAFAVACGADSDETRGLARYAEGMRAFLRGAYAESIQALSDWVEQGGADESPGEARYASAAMDRMDKLAEGPGASELIARARAIHEALAERVRDLDPD